MKAIEIFWSVQPAFPYAQTFKKMATKKKLLLLLKKTPILIEKRDSKFGK